MDGSTLVGVVGALVVTWVVLVVLLWLARPRGVRLADLVRVVPDLLRLVRDLLTDTTAPPSVRLALVGLLVWLISPIDLIPEFLPGIGSIDDVIVAVLVLRFVRRRLGDTALRERWRGTPESFGALLAILGGDRSAGETLPRDLGGPDPG